MCEQGLENEKRSPYKAGPLERLGGSNNAFLVDNEDKEIPGILLQNHPITTQAVLVILEWLDQ